MKNKVILITGANKGIGKTLSLEFSKMGVNIVLLGRNEESLDSVYDEIITTTSTKPLIIKCDLSNICLLYTSPSPRDVEESRMPSSA